MRALALKVGGWDTHSENAEVLSEQLEQVDVALAAFRDEMVAQRVWDDVTLVSASDQASMTCVIEKPSR